LLLSKNNILHHKRIKTVTTYNTNKKQLHPTTQTRKNSYSMQHKQTGKKLPVKNYNL